MGDSSIASPSNEDRSDYFKSSSAVSWQEYATLRPQYPDTIFDTISAYMAQHNQTGRQLCIDYGSGPGTVIPPILQRLNISRVIGTDLNARQLDEGKALLRQQYGPERFDTMVGAAGELHSVPDSSVDLVTCAEAVHWFPVAKWLDEVARILRPSGTLAIWYHPFQCFILSHPGAVAPCNRAFERFFGFAVPEGTGRLDTILASITLLDSIKISPGTFGQQARYKWHIPEEISAHISRPADRVMNQTPYTEAQARAGLLATPDVRIEAHVPKTAGETLMRTEKWTTKSLQRYLYTVGVSVDRLLADEEFRKSIREIEGVVGGPDAEFEVGWEIALILATRRP